MDNVFAELYDMIACLVKKKKNSYMVPTYKRKTERGAYVDETLKAATLALEEQPLKTECRLYSIPTRTLRSHRDIMVATRGVLALGPKNYLPPPNPLSTFPV